MRFYHNNQFASRHQHEDEEERTRRRIQQRHETAVETNWTCANEQRTKKQEEMAKSERILNSLIDEVRHKSKSSVHLSKRKEQQTEKSDDEESGKKHKKHKKKKRKREKENACSDGKSHRNCKTHPEKKEEKRTKRRKKSRRQSEEGEGEEEKDWPTKALQQLRVEVDGTKGRRTVTAKGGDGPPIGMDFKFFGFGKRKDDERKANEKNMERHKFSCDNTESDSEDEQQSDDGSPLPQKKQPTLANILASAPVSFPWLTAIGKAAEPTGENNEGEKAERSEKEGEQKAENSEEGTAPKDANTEKKALHPTKRKIQHRRHSSKRSSSKQSKHSKRKRFSRSRSRTYSTSPERAQSHEKGRNRRHRNDRPSPSKSPSPLPPFSKQRAFETRRKLIEESWHRRIELSVRPIEVAKKNDNSSDGNGMGESEYTDENGRIDKQKLLEIATRNATRLAMEGKLPKGAELVETIKNKSVEQLVDLCKKVQSDRSLVLKGNGDASSDNESDEEKRYSHKYEQWRQKEQRREDREFRNRAVRPAGEPARLSRREQKEIVRREENTLRLTFPVSSGVQHRTKANVPSPPETTAGPLIRFGDIGPLTTALAKVKTNIPSAYKPLSKPLPLSQPSSTLSSNFQGTSQVQIGPQLPSQSADSQPNKPLYSGFIPAKTLDCVNQNVYEIALAASARKEEADKSEKTGVETLPLAATSAQFIGPVVPNPAVDSVLTASRLFTAQSESAVSKPSSTSNSVFSSSWDRPGHIAAREALLKKVAEQKQREQQENGTAKVTADGTEAQKSQQLSQTAKQMPTADPPQCQQSQTPSSVPLAPSHPFSAPSASSSTPAQFSATPIAGASSSALPPQSEPSLPPPQQKHPKSNDTPTTTAKTASPTPHERTEADAHFKKPALPPAIKQTFVPSDSGTPMVLPTTKKPAQTELTNVPQSNATANGQKGTEPTVETEGQGKEFLDRFHTFVEAQVARQKAESALQATILSTAVQQQQQHVSFKEELATFASSSSFSSRPFSSVPSLASSRPDPLGLTKPQKSVQELVAERLRYSQRLQRDPNDFEARKALARVDKEMSSWAQDSSLPGEFTGHTGARVLSEKELEPSDPRFHAWAKKDQFRTAPEINSGIGLQLLQRMGWQPGQGLGRDRAGQLEPLALDVKADRKGLFSCFERAPTRESVLDPTGKNPVSVLMEQCARHRWRNPEFSCVESGPHNSRRYHWKALLNGVEYAPSLPSSNKKAGKAQVCMVILEALGLSTN